MTQAVSADSWEVSEVISSAWYWARSGYYCRYRTVSQIAVKYVHSTISSINPRMSGLKRKNDETDSNAPAATS